LDAGCPSPDAAQRGVPEGAAAQRVIVDLEKGDEPGGKHRRHHEEKFVDPRKP
jgi:hypothetical protein